MDKTRKCAICGTRYPVAKSWQKYDREDCRREAFRRSQKEKMRQEILAEMSFK